MPKNKKWIPPKDIDNECVDICEAMNQLPGLYTIESCCGHGRTPYWIFFHLDEETPEGLMNGLPILLYGMRHFKDDCHTSKWRVDVHTDCVGDTATFTLEGPAGSEGVKESKEIAKFLLEVLESRQEELEEIAKEIEEELAQKRPRTETVVSPATATI